MPEEELLQEIKLQFDRELDVKTKLDNKASGIITMAGAVATLFMGFGAFLLKEISISSIWLLTIGSLFLVAEIIITTFAIRSAIHAYRLRDYMYPMFYTPFFNPNSAYNENMVKNFTSRTKVEFLIHMIEQYLTSIKTNNDLNVEKANLIGQSQRLYLIALSMISPFAIIIVLSKFFQ